jgi:hypothetical protein
MRIIHCPVSDDMNVLSTTVCDDDRTGKRQLTYIATLPSGTENPGNKCSYGRSVTRGQGLCGEPVSR